MDISPNLTYHGNKFYNMKTILVDAIYTLILEEGGIFNEMYQLLEQYPNRKIILTSANDKQFEKFNLHDVPYEIFTLKHNPEKTDPEYYQNMLKHFKLEANEVIYFEHNEKAVESANSVGITSYHYDHSIKDLNNLKDFLDNNL